MVSFIEVNPADIDTSRSGRRGRVSYPIIKGFMELNRKVVKLDLQDLDKNPQYLRSVLQTYINNHNLPIKIFSAGGDLHLMRLDLNNDGTPNTSYSSGMRTTEGAAGHERDMTPMPLTTDEVLKRYDAEKSLTTK